MPNALRRILPLLLLTLLVGMAFPATAGASTDLTIPQARAHMLKLINTERTKLHLVPVRNDKRLARVAQGRSDDMAQNHYFAHLPDSQLVAKVEAQGIVWYKIGEILAKNDWPTLTESATHAIEDWRGSPTHWNIISSADFNYAAVGLALEPGTTNKIWTVLFLKGPDRTGARAWFSSVTPGSVTGTNRNVTVAWDGLDVKLSVLTAGLKNFDLQKQLDGGAWVDVLKASTARQKVVSLPVGHSAAFRVRARDKKSNAGYWVVSAASTT
jgi:hypothetical protein